jgi:hypothetical protein
MAKAKSGGTRSFLRGRVGSDVYSIGKDAKGKKQQVVRSLAESVANPQTLAQMRGRMIMSTIMQAVSAMSAVIDHSFDNVPVGQPNVSEFIRRNYAAVKADVAAHPSADNQFGLVLYGEKGIKKGAYIMAAGSAADLAGAQLDGDTKVLTISLSAGATIADLRAKLGLGNEDYFTAVCITKDSKFLYNRFHISQSLASTTAISADNIASIITLDGNVGVLLAFANNTITATFADFSENCGIIVSRKENSTYKHNDCVLEAPEDAAYTADVALATYPQGSQRFLNGGGESDAPFTPEPPAGPIALSNIMYGTTAKTMGGYVTLDTDGNNKAITFDAANIAANGGAKVQLSQDSSSFKNPTDLITIADGANTISARNWNAETSLWLVPNNGTPSRIVGIIESGD